MSKQVENQWPLWKVTVGPPAASDWELDLFVEAESESAARQWWIEVGEDEVGGQGRGQSLYGLVIKDIDKVADVVAHRRIVRLLELLPDIDCTWPELESPARFLLVEKGIYGDEWVTLHSSPAEAAEYHLHQEYAEEWEVARLVDLDGGGPELRARVVQQIEWEPVDS